MHRIAAVIYLSALTGCAANAQTVSTLVSGIEGSGDVSVGPEGDIYVADFGATLQEAGGANIHRLSPEGDIEVFSTGFSGASGNDFGPDGSLYQSDVARGEVYRVDGDGNRLLIAKGLTTPVGVTLAADGNVYVVQCGPKMLSRIEPDGTIQTIAQGAPLNCPNGLTVGPDGRLYTVNFADDAMIAIDSITGEMNVHAEIPGGGNGHIATSNGRFYVASYRGHRIYQVSMDGDVCPVAGSGEPGNADGGAANATFYLPNGLAVSADGDTLYTNTTTSITEAQPRPPLHPNAVRKVSGLKRLPTCKSNAAEDGDL